MSLRFYIALLLLLSALGYAVFLMGRRRSGALFPRRRRAPSPQPDVREPPGKREEKIQALIRAIPKGRVVTFAVLSAHAGPGFEVLRLSREVRAFATENQLPWWRVVRREGQRGMVSSAVELGEKQQQLLEGEGIRFEDGTFRLAKYEWQP